MAYNNEQALVDDFIGCLNQFPAEWSTVSISEQFDHTNGRTDVVVVADDDTVIAFEAKLTKWRKALQQAYRNTCFAHRSYIVVPENIAVAAFRFVWEFEVREVGICFIKDDKVVVLYEAPLVEPLQPWLSDEAKFFSSGDTQNATIRAGCNRGLS
jgi:hypothetical protein